MYIYFCRNSIGKITYMCLMIKVIVPDKLLSLTYLR